MRRVPPRDELPSLLGASLAAGVWCGGTTEAAYVWLDSRPWDWAAAGLRGAVFGAMFAVLALAAFASSPPTPGELAVRRLVRTGVLPRDADQIDLIGSLETEKARLLRSRWSSPAVGLVAAALVGAAAVRSPGPDAGVWALAGLWVVLAVAIPVVRRRRARLVDRAIAQLVDRARCTQPSGWCQAADRR